jgi:carboxyl-terminal processing protease
MPKEEIMRRLRGPKGTKVNLGVVRRGIADTLRFVVTRDKIPVKSIDAAYMIRPGIGYIRIGSFGAQTHEEFCQSIMKLTGEGMQSLILDLQENGGGYLHAAVAIANEFLDNNELIVYTQGRRVPRNEYRAQGNGLFEKGKVVVLVDSYSASAAEIVTGAIQDQDRGLVVGRRSYGKGLVQRPIDLPDGSMLRLTIAHYYTPSGRCIQKPYEKGKKGDYAMDVVNRLKSGELMHEDSIHFVDSLKYYTLKEHRVVYGGGGIMPDYYVPLDTTKYTRFHREMSARSLIINASLRYVDQQRKALKKQYPTFARFQQEFEIPASVTDGILAEAEKQNIKPKDDEELKTTMPYLKLQLKALVARDLWDTSQYFAVMNESNDVVKRALELMNQ